MKKEYLIEEPPFKALLFFAGPMILGNLFQQLYTMADSVIVGRFVGENSLAAVGASYSLTNVFISIAVGGGVGASVLTSQAFGRRDYRGMKRSIYTALFSFLTISILLGIIGLIFCEPLLQVLRTPDAVMGDAAVYLNIYFVGLPFLFMYNILSSMFNALGRSRMPLYLLILSSTLNVLLDLLMVGVWQWGVMGAAVATLIAQGLSAVVSFCLFVREIRRYPEKEPVRFSWPDAKAMGRIALPSILQQSTVSIGMMLVQSVVNSFGPEMLAGYSAAMRVESLCIVPMAALGNAVSSYTAQNLGANREDRVRQGYRVCYGLVLAFAVLIGVLVLPFTGPLTRLFLDENGTKLALSTGESCMGFMAWFYVLIGLKMITDGVLRGAGDMPVFTLANLLNLGLRVVLAVILAPRFGIFMVWAAVPMGWLVNYLVSFWRYRTGIWCTKMKKKTSSS